MEDDKSTYTLKLSKEVLAVVADAKKLGDTTDMTTIFMSAEVLIGSLAYLIGPLQDLEQAYRQEIKNLLEDGKSAAAAEAYAKAGDAYKIWKKTEHLYELAHEQILMLKKFGDKLENEYKRS